MMKTLFLLSLLISTSVSAQMTYGDRRAEADRDPRTTASRKAFNSGMDRFFEKLKSSSGLPALKLVLNDRMIAQYGRGKASAFKVVPAEVKQVVSFIKAAKSDRENLLHELLREKSYDEAQLRVALGHLARTKLLKISYWGYLSKSEVLPDFDLKSGTLSYFITWHEGISTYEKYPEAVMKRNIVTGIIQSMNYRPWYQRILE